MDDNELEAVLADALGPVTETHRRSARDAFAFRDLDAALAELIDEAVDAPAAVLRSGEQSGARQLRFAVSAGSVTLDIEPTSASTATIVVLCEGESDFQSCDLVSPQGVHSSEHFASGAVVFGDVDAGSTMRLELRRDGSVQAVTPWFSL